MDERKNTSYSPTVERPTAKKEGKRKAFGIVIALLLPVTVAEAILHASALLMWLTITTALICIGVLWRENIFRRRGRVILTVLASVEMIVMMVNLIPTDAVTFELPVPAVPPAVTVAPADDTTSTLANISQILFQQQQVDEGSEVIYNNEDEVDSAHEAQQQAILDTTVYSVYTNARYYHATTVCGTQSNRRSLTVREAMAEGMGACSKCNPPVYTG